MGNDAPARRREFTRTIEDFTCAHCHAEVKGNGYTDHCPRCLWGRHVDVNPGDRASGCGGMMKPVHAVYMHGIYIITYRCEKCKAEKRCKAAPDDDTGLLEALAGRKSYPITPTNRAKNSSS